MIHDSNRAFFIAPDLRFQSLQNLWSQDSQDESTALRFPYKITATFRIIPIIIRQHLRMLESIYYCSVAVKGTLDKPNASACSAIHKRRIPSIRAIELF